MGSFAAKIFELELSLDLVSSICFILDSIRNDNYVLNVSLYLNLYFLLWIGLFGLE